MLLWQALMAVGASCPENLNNTDDISLLQNGKLREENLALSERLRFLEQELQHVSMQLQH